jgi:iron complex transport system substrate-binding protein
MTRWRRALGAALLVSMAGTAQAQAGPVAATDDAGHRIELSAPARRIVTLAPHLAELVHAAGAGDQLVAVSRYSDHPPAVAALPVVGDALSVDYERILQLKPDLVLVWKSGMNPRHRDRLRALGLTVYESEIPTVQAIGTTLRRLGALAGTSAAAEAAERDMAQRWQALQRAHADALPVRVFYQLWHEPLMTVNRQHLISEAIRACGGINVFANLPTLTASVGWESALRADPQIVVTGSSRDEPPRLEAWQRHTRVAAVRQGQLKVLDGPALARMSPRFVDAAEDLCRLIDGARR